MKKLAALTLVVAVAVLVTERHQFTELSRQNEALQAQQRDALELQRENVTLRGNAIDVEEVSRLRLANQDLLKLRNEVGLLRKQKQDLDRLQLENQKLAKDLNEPKTNAGGATPGFQKSALFNAGHATPEKTLVTLLWAMREANLDALRNCFTPDLSAKFKEQTDEDLINLCRQTMRELTSFEIIGRTNVTADEVLLGVKTATEESLVPMVRVGGLWKLKDMGK
jgi:hypothetical protein